jgi:thiamine-monophosphate kinase
VSEPKRGMGEFDLIERYFAPLATTADAFALSDDAALFHVPAGEAGVVTTDAMVEGVHFFSDDAGDTVGWKLLAVNLSDLAAMGAKPLGYTLDLALPEQWTSAKGASDWVPRFADGLRACQERFATSLMGGDTVSTTGPLTLAVTAFGSVPDGKALRRSGAKPGDAIWVSGTIGDAALAVKLRKGWSPRVSVDAGALVARLDRPVPRLTLGLALRGIATAAIDVSDGLAADLAHICETSGVAAEVRLGDVPLSPAARVLVEADATLAATIVTGGDDYELLFTAPASAAEAVQAAGRASATPVACIGTVAAGTGIRVLDSAGRPLTLQRLGFTHF